MLSCVLVELTLQDGTSAKKRSPDSNDSMTNTSSPSLTKESELKMETLKSANVQYEIIYSGDYTGWVQLVEYVGEAPRREVSRTSIPFEMIAMLMDKMLFNTTAVVEPSKTELNIKQATLS